MHGTGNDFIVIEDFNNNLAGTEEHIAQRLCHRRFGIGGDGIILVRKSDEADIKMDLFNADGSYAAMCGNGIRCFSKYVFDKGIINNKTIKIKTGDGIKTAYLTVEKDAVSTVTINMGKCSFKPEDIPANSEDKIIEKEIQVNGKKYIITSMLMGVPHTVIMCKLDEVDVEEGKQIEKFNLFPKGTNVNFCEVIDEKSIKIKTWERGAGATLACGTGSCASVITANMLGYTDKKVKVTVPGGELMIDISNDNILMTGPAVTVFEGEVNI